eukprot:g3765.t1
MCTAAQWIAWDPNPATRAVISAADAETLGALLGSRLQFGTAGLRGPMGAGTSRMNDLTVIQATQGLAAYLEDTLGADVAKQRGVVIGHDHRARPDLRLSSHQFARVASLALSARGFNVCLLEGEVATPLVAFAVRHRNHAAGIMITASHNPKEDNGYKVYWGNGSQIVPPHDNGISQCIEANLEVDAALFSPEQVAAVKVWDGSAALYDAYFAAICGALCRREQLVTRGDAASPPCKIVYTAMHGVGHRWCTRAFKEFGLAPYLAVAEQCTPDPTFPTVEFPNPEEGAGALELATTLAEAQNATIVLANDPDADRLAVAERQENGEWRCFSGNDIGTLLAAWELQWHKEAHGGQVMPGAVMLASTVSSKLLGAMARAEGFVFEDTLTGFKWMGTRAADIEQECRDAGDNSPSGRATRPILFSYEQAIGFCIGDTVRDKDGVSAAAVFAEMCNFLYAPAQNVEGKSAGVLSRKLDALCRTYGFFKQCDGHFYYKESSTIDAIFARLRNGGNYWHRCGSLIIKDIRDLTGAGYDSSKVGGVPVLPTSASHMITYTFEEGGEAGGAVVTLRTSGTEPKLKYYVEVSAGSSEESSAIARKVADIVVSEMLQPQKNGLTKKPQ